VKLTYRGELPDGVVLDRDTYREYAFEHGKAFEVPDEFGRRLIEEQPGLYGSEDYSAAPAKSAHRDEWEAYRAAQGHDVDGLTKAQLIELPDQPAQED
jgi:hypothetical protein